MRETVHERVRRAGAVHIQPVIAVAEREELAHVRFQALVQPRQIGDDERALAPARKDGAGAASKAAADFLLAAYRKQFGFPLLTVRATNVYGARQQLFKIIPRSAIYLQTGHKIELHGGGRAIKSYIHIRDVSRGELAILEQGELGHIYHLSPDQGIAVRDVVERLCRDLGKSFAESTITVDERPGQDAAYVIDSTRARTELGWQPHVTLDQGLSEVVSWVQANLSTIRQLPLSYHHRP